MKTIFKVISQTDAVSVQKQDGTSINKSTIVLQEIGGKYENTYVATLLGNSATVRFLANDIVFAALRFTSREYNGILYMDCIVQDIIKITESAF